MKNTACFDIDGTLANQKVFVSLVKSELDQGFLEQVAYDNIASILTDFKNGAIEYEIAARDLLVAHAKGLRGQSVHELSEHAESFFRSCEPTLFRYFGRKAIELLRTSHNILIVTAEPRYVAGAAARLFEADDYFGTDYAVADDVFTGGIIETLAHRDAKRRQIDSLAVDYAFGDTIGDVDMLQHAKYPIAISPDEQLAGVARERGWLINSGEAEDYPVLSALLKKHIENYNH